MDDRFQRRQFVAVINDHGGQYAAVDGATDLAAGEPPLNVLDELPAVSLHPAHLCIRVEHGHARVRQRAATVDLPMPMEPVQRDFDHAPSNPFSSGVQVTRSLFRRTIN